MPLRFKNSISISLSAAILLPVIMPLLFTAVFGWQKFRMRHLDGIEQAIKTEIILPIGNKALKAHDEFYHENEKYDVVSVKVRGDFQHVICVNDRLERKLELAMEKGGETKKDAHVFKIFLKEFPTMHALKIMAPALPEKLIFPPVQPVFPDPDHRAYFIPPEHIS